MSFKVFTICLEKKSNAKLLTDLVATLAGNQRSHAQAVHVLPSGMEYIPLSPYYHGAPLVNLYEEYLKIAAEIKQNYESCQKSHADSITWSWHEYRGHSLIDYTHYFRHAIASDLVVCAKPANISIGSDLPRNIINESEVPVLVVPETYTVENSFENVMIAWNETPEAASAIRDALPILKQAKQVVLLNVSSRIGDSEVKGTDMARYLGEHEISIEIDHRESKGDVGHTILKHVSDNYMDLLVMGGYGHSKLYNMTFGAATPQILKELSCPVFLSK